MDRRDFLKNGGAALGAFALQHAGLTQAPANAAAGRLLFPMNRNWRFSAQRAEGDTAPGFDDSHFERVTIPHTNKPVPWHSFDEKLYQFVSIYRRRFRLPAEAQGRLVFVDFDGAMTAAKVWLNGRLLGEYKGGYTPFSFDLTPLLDWKAENILAVELDSTERPDIPPFGGSIDYLTFGGIYRDVRLRAVAYTFIDSLFIRPVDVMSNSPSVDVVCQVGGDQIPARQEGPLMLEAELLYQGRSIVKAAGALDASRPPLDPVVRLMNLGPVERWSLESPQLYTLVARLIRGGRVVDEDRRRFGFRQAEFTDHGFELNGKVVKLRGLDRHQTFPWVGQAMPARVQRRDAEILRRELKINIVRTSHYPQSPAFLDACDELGLLVLEEIPGWNHIGDAAWKDISVDNVRRMVTRDAHHPSIVLWGVRINESRDDHDFYTRTNAMAHQLDPTRQTGGIRDHQDSELLEDVFTMNDFGWPLLPPNHPRYLNTEFCGHTYPTKPYDAVDRLTEHIRRHARVHNQLGSNPQYAGGIGWCAFDYDTHGNFGSGDRICYHGVSDIFRLPKPAGHFYRSQCDPAEDIVLEPAFDWSARGDWSAEMNHSIICSNCDRLKIVVRDRVIEAEPDRATYPNLPHPPFQVDLERVPYADMRIEGYLAGQKVVERNLSSRGLDQQFIVAADDNQLRADGADSTRITFRVADEYGNLRRYATAAIRFHVEGPVQLIGDNPFALVGGCGAVWIRAQFSAGTAVVRAIHPALGALEVRIQIAPAPAERL
ncbi:MAG: glycoside hydrolase family 2 protein [Acidobacteria bacterium]|nr:glycoside hydrolase family 2 protein [Acidobacteriota bacterium]